MGRTNLANGLNALIGIWSERPDKTLWKARHRSISGVPLTNAHQAYVDSPSIHFRQGIEDRIAVATFAVTLLGNTFEHVLDRHFEFFMSLLIPDLTEHFPITAAKIDVWEADHRVDRPKLR